jgi:hypothetical protein
MVNVGRTPFIMRRTVNGRRYAKVLEERVRGRCDRGRGVGGIVREDHEHA